MESSLRNFNIKDLKKPMEQMMESAGLDFWGM